VKVTVVFLGRASDIIGRSVMTVELPDGATLDDLIRFIGEKVNPRFYRRHVDGHYVYVPFVNNVPVHNTRDYVLKDGDRVMFITPEMGG